MKTAILLILLSIAICFAACTTSQTSTTQVVVLNDITDSFLSRPVPQELISLYGFDKNLYNGGIFQFSDLTKVSFNETQGAEVGNVNEWLSNQLLRKQQIDTFEQAVTNIVAQGNQTPDGENNSSIYFPIANTLNALAQSSAHKKYVLIYSDLMENTDEVSFYSASILKEIQNKPAAIKALLESQVQLQSLSGITIYLLYEPRTELQDQEYKIVSAFYKSFFESKGAAVIITPNLSV